MKYRLKKMWVLQNLIQLLEQFAHGLTLSFRFLMSQIQKNGSRPCLAVDEYD